MNDDLNINKGFEAMLPKPKSKEKKPQLSNFVSFKIFSRRFTFSLEVKEEKNNGGSTF